MEKPWKVILAFVSVFIAGAIFGGVFSLRAVGKRTVESLIKVGAMRAMGTRPQLLSALDRMVVTREEAYLSRKFGKPF